jgi:hypothetical protein
MHIFRYILIGLNAESGSTIFEFLLKEGGSTMIYFLITSTSALLVVIMLACALYLSCDGVWAAAIMGTVLIATMGLVLHFGAVQARLMPYQYSGWGIFANLGFMWNGDTKRRARIRGRKIAAEARHNILGSGAASLDDEYAEKQCAGDLDTKGDKAVMELSEFLQLALVKTFRPTSVERCNDLAGMLINEDIDAALLKDMASMGGNSDSTLVESLRGLGSRRTAITTGETLAIIHYLHTPAESAIKSKST